MSGKGERFSSFGGHESRACACHEQEICVEPSLRCNCDKGIGVAFGNLVEYDQ